MERAEEEVAASRSRIKSHAARADRSFPARRRHSRSSELRGQSRRLPRRPIDDSRVTLKSPADVEAKRREIVEFIWGSAGLPTDKMPASIEKSVTSPLPFAVENLDRVDRFVFDLGYGVKNEAFHFVPRSSNGRLVIVHQGHAASLDSGDIAQTIAALVARGFGVWAR